ncbi:MAG: hypothetical protein U0903_10610 [Planctomycetales bacterium]
MGASTFQIESDYNDSGFTAGVGFITDNPPVPPTGSIFNDPGLPLPGPPAGQFGEQPYGWNDQIAPGTFQFLIP